MRTSDICYPPSTGLGWQYCFAAIITIIIPKYENVHQPNTNTRNMAPLIAFVCDWFLICRTETMLSALQSNDMVKFEKVVDNTLATIANANAKDVKVHKVNVDVYIKNIEFAQLMCYLDVKGEAKKHVELAADVIARDLATMTPAYIMVKRIAAATGGGNSVASIGSLSQLPSDVSNLVSTMVIV